MTTTLVWFRQDLRVKDNPALSAAAKADNVLPIYILDENVPEKSELGGASKWWLHHALSALNKSLDGNLRLFKGSPKEIIHALCLEHNIDKVVWNRMYESWAISRDSDIKKSLKDKHIVAESFNGSLLWEPMQILKGDGTPYKVYTPYFKNGCLKAKEPRYPIAAPTIHYSPFTIDNTNSLEQLALLPTIKWDVEMKMLWDISEKGGQDKLAHFIDNNIEDYTDKRNLPAVNGTSLLSPYFHFGLLSTNQAWYAVLHAYNGSMENKGVYTYLSELGWREFSYYLLFHFNDIQNANYNTKFDKFPWRSNDEHLRAWQKGQTGVPIIDAGMRELWKTGYMHNRVRMIVASYLVKNLLIDWREGERWFWDCLLDADTASNAASWQWVAGSGADAAPYFRIFNPVLQGEKFDKEGQYVKQYCPELSDLPKKFIHKPWDAPAAILAQANITLGDDYPEPLVCLKASRQRALDAFSEIK